MARADTTTYHVEKIKGINRSSPRGVVAETKTSPPPWLRRSEPAAIALEVRVVHGQAAGRVGGYHRNA